ncbi:hypothetical protein [Arthrobacter sp. MYb227]|uniref:hypothetical protein n=1 Tax=Arthrobacter sp. MYb227 TaxID=1848601 RepID=UPI0011B000E4|nr:hypothetical protein [Arthrobacter sp. MYb227]
MMTAQKNRARRAVAAAALAVLALGVTSCGAINEQATTFQYAASDGIVLNVADLEVRNLMFVTKSATDEARVLGSVVNNTASAQTLELKLATGSVTIPVAAKSVVKLEDAANKTVLSSTGVIPGEQAKTTLSVSTSSDQALVPVIDGTLKEYRQYVPGGFDPSEMAHLTPSPKAEGH